MKAKMQKPVAKSGVTAVAMKTMATLMNTRVAKVQSTKPTSKRGK